jgi:hypothetical protein
MERLCCREWKGRNTLGDSEAKRCSGSRTVIVDSKMIVCCAVESLLVQVCITETHVMRESD